MSGHAIDIAAGMERALGDRRMFMRFLDRFCSDFARTPSDIRAALAAGDAELAQRLAHTLKGAAGMIEAKALQQRALALEQALRSGAGARATEMELMEAELGRVLAEGRQLVAGDGPAAARAGPTVPAPAPQDAISRLRELLDLGNGTAVDLMHDARLELVAALGEARYGDIAAAIDKFDFEQALRLLGGPNRAR
jgi:HPt (histidine-containing phosphotransfer) domain-containing protein